MSTELSILTAGPFLASMCIIWALWYTTLRRGLVRRTFRTGFFFFSRSFFFFQGRRQVFFMGTGGGGNVLAVVLSGLVDAHVARVIAMTVT